MTPSNNRTARKQKIRYAVVGLGHIAQAAVLPAFENASENSQLTALVSSDPDKLRTLGKKYGVQHCFSYDEYDACLQSGEVDAVFIALPNHLHCEYTVRAAEAGRHILCEKPMAVNEMECRKMIEAATVSDVRLMIAYRLHLEAANLSAIEIAQSGQIGELRFFNSSFSMQVRDENVRITGEAGGGTLYDIGVYCINAARNLFGCEPEEVSALSVQGSDPRFAEVDEATSVLLRFPGDRLACFTTSFGAADVSSYRIVGTEGDVRLDPAYSYAGPLTRFVTREGKTTKKTFRKRDQFAAELVYFSNCVLQGQHPEPSGWEGLADVRIVEALYKSAADRRAISLQPFEKPASAELDQEIHKPAHGEPKLVHVESPSR